MKISTKLLVNLSLFIALAIIFRRILNIFTPFGEINFGGFPIILAGLIFGPACGAIVGAISDILGYPLFPRGPYFPHFTLTSALAGMIPALIYNPFKCDNQKPSFLLLMISIFIGQFITSALMVSYFLQALLNIPFKFSFIERTLSLIIRAPIYAFLSVYVIKGYNSYKKNRG